MLPWKENDESVCGPDLQCSTRADNFDARVVEGCDRGDQRAETGSVTVRRAPPASALTADTRPLWVTTIFCTSASPRPVPRAFGVTNGRNIVEATAAPTPGPLSVTEARSVPCARSSTPATVTFGTTCASAHA